MVTPEDIIGRQPDIVQKMFRYWTGYMEKNISFGLYDSDIHTTSHCERVLLYALIMGQIIFKDNENYLETLAHAAVFHDTRRVDDYLDRGHGARAAKYYEEFCKNKSIVFHKDAYSIMAFHDQDDNLGISHISTSSEHGREDSIRLYKIFKDADALDRYRLGPWGLNKKFLRNDEAISLMDFASNLVKRTVDPEFLALVTEATRKYIDRIAKGE